MAEVVSRAYLRRIQALTLQALAIIERIGQLPDWHPAKPSMTSAYTHFLAAKRELDQYMGDEA